MPEVWKKQTSLAVPELSFGNTHHAWMYVDSCAIHINSQVAAIQHKKNKMKSGLTQASLAPAEGDMQQAAPARGWAAGCPCTFICSVQQRTTLKEFFVGLFVVFPLVSLLTLRYSSHTLF